MKKALFSKSGGYRKLHSFNFATLIHLSTISFCKRFIPYREDPLGKTSGQMIGAARSGRQNIVEGSERAGTSKETEMKLTDVSRASLGELLGDLEIFLAERCVVPWSVHSDEHKAVSSLNFPDFEYSDDLLHDYWTWYHREKVRFCRWVEHGDPLVCANALVILIRRAMSMLGGQMRHQGEAFLDEGGFRERLTTARVEVRDSSQEPAPGCPLCGKPMRQRTARKGANAGKQFWSCSAYPNCKGVRPIASP